MGGEWFKPDEEAQAFIDRRVFWFRLCFYVIAVLTILTAIVRFFGGDDDEPAPVRQTPAAQTPPKISQDARARDQARSDTRAALAAARAKERERSGIPGGCVMAAGRLQCDPTAVEAARAERRQLIEQEERRRAALAERRKSESERETPEESQEEPQERVSIPF